MRMAVSKQTSDGKDVEKLELLYIASGAREQCSHFEKLKSLTQTYHMIQ